MSERQPFRVSHPMEVGGIAGMKFPEAPVVEAGWSLAVIRDGQPTVEKASPEEAAEFDRRWPRAADYQAFVPNIDGPAEETGS